MLLDCGHPHDIVMAYPLATIWAEYQIVKLREGGRMVSESLLQQSMLAASFSGKDGGYKKQLEELSNGR